MCCECHVIQVRYQFKNEIFIQIVMVVIMPILQFHFLLFSLNLCFASSDAYGDLTSLCVSLCLLPQAYSVYDEEIGYCQGQSFLAAVLLLHVSSHISRVQQKSKLSKQLQKLRDCFVFNWHWYLIDVLQHWRTGLVYFKCPEPWRLYIHYRKQKVWCTVTPRSF